jgi:hypothetical protein
MANGLVSGTAAAFLLVLFNPAPETLLPLVFPGFLLLAVVALVVAGLGAYLASGRPATSGDVRGAVLAEGNPSS